MALKLRKDVKKSSYYVWFLGAKESKGLRGDDFVVPVIRHLERREKDVEPFKVTLQVSHKGLKIVQNVSTVNNVTTKKPKSETVKHFIPHNTIAWVYQQADVIGCILLLFNPVTKCPLHVHAYRCDSLETATVLRQQLQTLIDRTENQKKFAEIEARLAPKVLKKESSLGSDASPSESSEERYSVGDISTPTNHRVTNLYDSVAAELRQKLTKNNVPILLPPRDYDTVHRQKGNLTGIELRRCLNVNIVGQNVAAKNRNKSCNSSGIGSDHPPTPETPDARFVDTRSSSDEDEWNNNHRETAAAKSPKAINDIGKYLERSKQQYNPNQGKSTRQTAAATTGFFEDDGFEEHIRYKNRTKYEPEPLKSYPVPKMRQKPPACAAEEKQLRPKSALEEYTRNYRLRQRTPSPCDSKPGGPRQRFQDAKQKFLSMEREKCIEAPIAPITKPATYVKRHESLQLSPSNRMDRYRNVDRMSDLHKRRSMHNLVEDDPFAMATDKRILANQSRIRGEFSKSSSELAAAAGYHRHSYVEPNKMHKNNLQRTNSVMTSTNNGRMMGFAMSGVHHHY